MKGRKILTAILIVMVLLTSLAVLSSCGEKKLDAVVFNDAVFTYDGVEHSIEVKGLPDGATVTYSPSNTYTDIGTYLITATVSYKKQDSLELTATMHIIPPDGYALSSDIDEILAKLNESLNAAEQENDEKIEALRADYQAKIDALTASNTSLQAALDTLTSAYNAKVADLESSMQDASTAITTLRAEYEAEVEEINEAISANTTAINAAEDELQDKIDSLSARYTAEINTINTLIDDLIAYKNDATAELEAAKDRIAELETRVAELLVVTRHTVTFDLTGGIESIPEQNVVHGYKAIKPEDPTKEGYNFVGWYLGDEEWSFIGYSVTEDITLSAKWVRKTYTVTFEGESDSITVSHGDTITLPEECTLPYEGVFEGWSFNGIKWEKNTPVTCDMTLAPRFACYVKYDLGGGGLHDNPTVIRSDDTYPILLSAPTRPGYTFLGWYADSSFYGDDVDTINCYGSHTLYAFWVLGDSSTANYPWDKTTITFSINEDSDLGQLSSTSRRYLAGCLEDSELKDHSKVDNFVEKRNMGAEIVTNVSVNYQYLPDSGNYGWGNNIQYIYRQATSGDSYAPDVYVNFVYDMVAASLKGAFANLYSTTMYGEGHAWSSSEYNYFAFEDYRNYKDTGKDYMYDYMRSLTLSKHKMYCLASDYLIDTVRASLIIPVNVEMLETIPMSSNEGDANSDRNGDGKFDIQDFYELVWAYEWNYETLAYLANAVTRQTGTEEGIGLDDTIGFALGTSSGLPASGMLYTTSITIVKKTFNGSDYEYSYPNITKAANGQFVFDNESEDATFEQLDTFTKNLATLVGNDGVITVSYNDARYAEYSNDTEAIRKKFANNTLLFGGVIVLGGLEHQDYVSMKGEGKKGYGIVPIPYYHTDLADDESYSTQIHNNGKIAAISIGTRKFAQCTAYLNYQSTNSNKVLNEYYNQKLRQTVQVSGTYQNSEMLYYIRKHVRSNFDKTFEDALGAHYSAQSSNGYNMWHTMIKDANFYITDMRAQYARCAPTKAYNLSDLTEVYLTLPT